MKRLAPSAIAIGGVIGITVAIGLIASMAPVRGPVLRYRVKEPGVGYRLEG